MTLTSTTRSPAPGRRRDRAAYAWLSLSAVGIAVFAPLPYATASLHELSKSSDLAANYLTHGPAVRLALYAHIAFGGLALLLAPAQFAAPLRRRYPRMHRVAGRVALSSIGVAGLAGLVISPFNSAGPVGTAGFGLLALLWLSCGWTAYRAIRGGDITRHRRWACRTFALTYAAVTLRLWLGVLIAAQLPFGVGAGTAFERAYLVVPFLAWVPNLLVAELYLRRRPQPDLHPVRGGGGRGSAGSVG